MFDVGGISLTRWTMKFINPDIIIFKLALSLFAFSKTNYSYFPNISIDSTNSYTIYHIQNKYAEVTWKYLNYRFGRCEAVKHFHSIIYWHMALTESIIHAQTVSTHVDNIDSLVELTELTLILDDVEEIIETK
ncbi:unnamed protein product [Adineta steineri]|uniref:Uncharacterized protein n=1 Tax=Adineta steineri TaxID=433720 RepID=A0A820K5B4_9BILA|nr:unnamed protein product [Adineta steineri]